MNKYIAVVSENEKVLKGPVKMDKPDGVEQWDNTQKWKDYQSHLASLPIAFTNVEWLGEDENGKILTLDVDFKIEKRSEFYSGDYWSKCVVCGKEYHNSDKRWHICEPCCNELIAVPINQEKESLNANWIGENTTRDMDEPTIKDKQHEVAKFKKGDKINLNTGYSCDIGIVEKFENGIVYWKNNLGDRLYNTPIDKYNITIVEPEKRPAIEDTLYPFVKQLAKEIASAAWKSAANAYRMYPDNKHTFADYWNDYGEKQLNAGLPMPNQDKQPERMFTLKNRLTEVRNDLYDKMPSGELKAWDLVIIIKNHLTALDEVIDTIKL